MMTWKARQGVKLQRIAANLRAYGCRKSGSRVELINVDMWQVVQLLAATGDVRADITELELAVTIQGAGGANVAAEVYHLDKPDDTEQDDTDEVKGITESELPSGPLRRRK